MRNMVKTKTVEGRTYNMFFDSADSGEDRGQYGFSIDDAEVAEVTTDVALAKGIFAKLTAGAVSPVHLMDVIEDSITEEAMV